MKKSRREMVRVLVAARAMEERGDEHAADGEEKFHPQSGGMIKGNGLAFLQRAVPRVNPNDAQNCQGAYRPSREPKKRRSRKDW